MQRADMRWATTVDGFKIAYQTAGDGDFDQLMFKDWGAALDAVWEHPGIVRAAEFQASVSRVIWFDRRGFGASDPVPLDRLGRLEDWVEDARAVLGHVGSDRVAVVADGFACQAAISFAVSHPARVSRLLLLNGFARLTRDDGYPYGIDAGAIDAVAAWIRDTWGTGGVVISTSRGLGSDDRGRELAARTERCAASPTTAAEMVRASYLSDIRELLPHITVPTMVAHTGDLAHVSVDQCRYLADHIPGAEFVESHSTSFYWGDESGVRYQQFIAGTNHLGTERTLAAVVFTDVVGSTQLATAWGDSRWRRTLDAIDSFMASLAARFGGRVVKQTGDGHLLVFTAPGPAVKAASAVVRAADELEVGLRAGVHLGEIEARSDGDVGGIAVHLAARVAALASSGEVLVTRTVRDVLGGADIKLTDRGEWPAKGFSEPLHVYAVTQA